MCLRLWSIFRSFLSTRECNKKQHTVEHVKTEMVKNGRHNHFSWTDKSQAEQTSCLLTAAFSVLYGFGETHTRKQREIKEGKYPWKFKRNYVPLEEQHLGDIKVSAFAIRVEHTVSVERVRWTHSSTQLEHKMWKWGMKMDARNSWKFITSKTH